MIQGTRNLIAGHPLAAVSIALVAGMLLGCWLQGRFKVAPVEVAPK